MKPFCWSIKFSVVVAWVLLGGMASAGTQVQGNLVPWPPVCRAGTCTNGAPGVCKVNIDCDVGTVDGAKSKVIIRDNNTVTVVVRVARGSKATPKFYMQCITYHLADGDIGIYCYPILAKASGSFHLTIQNDGTGIPGLDHYPRGHPLNVIEVSLFAPPTTGCTGSIEVNNPDCESGGKIATLGIIRK